MSKPKRIYNNFSEDTKRHLIAMDIHSEDELHKAAHLGWYNELPSDVRAEILAYVELLEKRKIVEKAKADVASAGRKFHKKRKKVEQRMLKEEINPRVRTLRLSDEITPAPLVPPDAKEGKVRRRYYAADQITKTGKIKKSVLVAEENKRMQKSIEQAAALLAKMAEDQKND